MREAVLLVMANKMDLPTSMSVAEVAEGLGLMHIRNRKWHLQPCVAITGDGLYEGLDWVAKTISQ